MLRIIPADPRLVEVVLSVKIDMPAVAFIGLDGETFAGSGGLAWGKGRCWMWFTTSGQPQLSYAFATIRMAKVLFRKASQLGESEVYTIRDASFPNSKKLLELLRFEEVGVEDGQELWRVLLFQPPKIPSGERIVDGGQRDAK